MLVEAVLAELPQDRSSVENRLKSGVTKVDAIKVLERLVASSSYGIRMVRA
jgi:hypothetical protein